MSTLIIIAVSLYIIFYFLPTYIAKKRGHRNKLAIFILNLFLGWLVIGWIIAIIWACTSNVEPRKKIKKVKKSIPIFKNNKEIEDLIAKKKTSTS